MKDDGRAAAPVLLTVEEAAVLLRIGRTKAYDLTREWRATGGRSGLPVVDLGNLLRVPRPALEALLGVDLSAPLCEPRAATTETPEPAVQPAGSSTLDRTPRTRRTQLPTNQLDLFDAPAS